MNLAQLVRRVRGRIDKLHDPVVTKLDRLIQSLDRSGTVEGGVSIAAAPHDRVPAQGTNYEQSEKSFPVSHRVQNQARTTDHWPVRTHLGADRSPLQRA